MYRPSDLGWSWKRRKSRSPPPLFFLISSRLFSSFFSRQPVKMVTKNLERGKEGRGGGGGGGGLNKVLYWEALPLGPTPCSFKYHF